MARRWFGTHLAQADGRRLFRRQRSSAGGPDQLMHGHAHRFLFPPTAATQIQRLEVIANNLANVDTPGFKRDLAIIQSRYTEAMGQGLSSPRGGGSDELGAASSSRRPRPISLPVP